MVFHVLGEESRREVGGRGSRQQEKSLRGQINTLYTLNFYIVMCQSYLYKAR